MHRLSFRASSHLRLLLLATLGVAIVQAAPLPRMHPNSPWYQTVDSATLHPQSSAMITQLTALGGFGNNRLQIDFAMQVYDADQNTPTRNTIAIPGPGNGYYSPDCEALGTMVPVPAAAAIEGTTSMTCDNLGEDCHYLVVRGNQLFETYRTTTIGNDLQIQCVAVWQRDALYPAQGRGDHCTSADAAGFPIAPLLFNADEVAAAIASSGDLGHAIRFILPNARMASDAALGGEDGKLYVRPASHAGGPSGPAGSVPYGSRLRLRPDFPLTSYNPAAQVILRTLKRYGMVLADGGNIALTAESDRNTTAQWADLGVDSRIFDLTPGATDVFAADFQVVDTGPRIAETYECVRAAPAVGILFINGFE